MATPPDLEQLIGDTRRLVECESPSSDEEALARGRAVLSTVVADRIEPPTTTAEEAGTLSWTWGTGHAKTLLLGHLDTVWPMGTLADIPFSTDGTTMRGPACFDMKAGLVIAIHAIAMARRTGPNAGRIQLLVTSDEETGSHRSRRIIEAHARDATATLCLEGSGDGGALKTERKGTAHVTIQVTGRAAHAGLEPENGINAAVEAGHLLTSVGALSAPQDGTTVTPTMVTSGTTRNTVPALAEVMIDIRATTMAELERVHHQLHDLAANPTVSGAVIDIVGDIGRPPMEASSSAGLFSLATEVSAALGFDAPTSLAVGGGSDANFTAQLGVPSLCGLGAVGGGAHATHEHVELSCLVPRVRLIHGMLTRLAEDRQRGHTGHRLASSSSDA